MILSAACASLLALVALAVVPTTLVAPAIGTGVYDFELRRVADGIYVASRSCRASGSRSHRSARTPSADVIQVTYPRGSPG